jgi:4-hydroxythreonine-4-phosphate dehydrogenase
MQQPQTLAVTLGDRYGIGPELVVRLVPELIAADGMRTVIVGDWRVFEDARARFGAGVAPPVVGALADAPVDARVVFLDRPFDAEVGPLGRVCGRAGAEVLETLTFLIGEIDRGAIDGLLYAPLNKQAMRDAGHPNGDELDFIAAELEGGDAAGELNIFDGLWASRVTSHVPLSKVAELITRPSVESSIRLVASAMRRSGIERPRIAVAALNPHAGENGLFGSEEIEVIAPAVNALRAEGENVEGPFPADTVFPRARSSGMNAVVTMYHDQGQIALKAVGLGKSVTLLAGLDVPIVTPGHGTAFDIVGKGVAEMAGMRAALALCRTLM